MSRWGLRRGDPADDTASAPVTASFAGVLDGRSLWVAVAAQPGRLALRRAGTDEVLDVSTEEVTDQPGYLGARLDLSDLDGTEGRYDVVLIAPDGSPAPVTSGPREPATTRPSTDGLTQHALVRTPEETLRIRTTLLPAAAGLLGVRRLDGAIELTLSDAGPELALLGDDGRPLVSWPVDHAGIVTITHDSIAHLDQETRPAMTGHAGSYKPVRRRANDLADPRVAAPLPQLDQPTSDRPRLRLPWSREAHLLVRVFPVETGGGTA